MSCLAGGEGGGQGFRGCGRLFGGAEGAEGGGGFGFIVVEGEGEGGFAFFIAGVEVDSRFDELLLGDAESVAEGVLEHRATVFGVAGVGVGSGVDEFLTEEGHLVVIPDGGGVEGSASVVLAGEIDVGTGGDEMAGGGDIAFEDGDGEGGVATGVEGVWVRTGGEGFVDDLDVAAAGSVDDEPGGVVFEPDFTVDSVAAEEVDDALVALVDGEFEGGAVGGSLEGVDAGVEEELGAVFVVALDGPGEFGVAVLADGVEVCALGDEEVAHVVESTAEPAHGGSERAAAFVVEGVGVGTEGEEVEDDFGLGGPDGVEDGGAALRVADVDASGGDGEGLECGEVASPSGFVERNEDE